MISQTSHIVPTALATTCALAFPVAGAGPAGEPRKLVEFRASLTKA